MGNQEIVRANQAPIRIMPRCADQETNKLLTPYCFGDATDAESRKVEQHLLDCDQCWAEARRLDAAVQSLQEDRSLLQMASPAEVASAFGISGKLGRLLGGHIWHAIAACAIYAALFAIGLMVEVAYHYDRYRETAVYFACGMFGWIFATSMAGLALDWRLTGRGSSRGLLAATGVFAASAASAFIAACFYLPSTPVSDLSMQAYTAQAAYLKTIIYFIVFLFVFMLPPFNFVLSAQKECAAGRHALIGGLLSGEKLSVAPKGSIYPKLMVLICFLAVIMLVTLFLHQNLMNHLKPGPYMGLFSNLIFARLALFYAFTGECLLWYYLSLNELKRECMAVSRIKVSRTDG